LLIVGLVVKYKDLVFVFVGVLIGLLLVLAFGVAVG